MDDSEIYTTEDLPEQARVFGACETRRYRDCVCEILNLTFKPIGGEGNCFFESVATLLALVPNQQGIRYILDATILRARVIDWLRNCAVNQGAVYDECMLHMYDELRHPLTGLIGKKKEEQMPKNVPDYLQLSSQNGVWVAGRI